MFAALTASRGKALAAALRARWRLRLPSLAALSVLAAVAHAQPQPLLVVTEGDSPAFAQAIDGMRSNGTWLVDVARADAGAGELAARLGRAAPGTPLVALGTQAARAVAPLAANLPHVDCMVAGDPAADTGATVVPLAVPIATHVRWLSQLLPRCAQARHRVRPRTRTARPSPQRCANSPRPATQVEVEPAPAHPRSCPKRWRSWATPTHCWRFPTRASTRRRSPRDSSSSRIARARR